ncbi:MAG: hypothetical protein OD811_04995, partial [Alphaproteobacteria bacterium]
GGVGGVLVGEGGSLTFTDTAHNVSLTFTDTTGPTGTGAPDGYIDTLSERRVQTTARPSAAGEIAYSFNVSGNLPERLTAAQFSGLPTLAKVEVKPIVVLSLARSGSFSSAKRTEGSIFNVSVSASLLTAAVEETIDFRLLGVENGVEESIRDFNETLRFEEADKGVIFAVSTSVDGVMRGDRLVRVVFSDLLPRGYLAHSSARSLDYTLADADVARLRVVASSGKRATINGEVRFTGTLEAPDGGILVGEGGMLTFAHRFDDGTTPALELTFTDTTDGAGGGGDGYLKGSELVATSEAWIAPELGVVSFSFARTGTLPADLEAAQFPGLPAELDILVDPVATFSLVASDEGVVFEEGKDVKAAVSASVVVSSFNVVFPFRLIDVSGGGVESEFGRGLTFTEGGKGEKFVVGGSVPGADGIVRGARALRLEFGDTLPRGYVADTAASSLDLILADKDKAALRVSSSLLENALGLPEGLAGDEVIFTGVLGAPDGGILVGTRGTLTFTHTFADSTPALVLTFTDTSGDGFLKGDELLAKAAPWIAVAGAFQPKFTLSGDLPGDLTEDQFPGIIQPPVNIKQLRAFSLIAAGGKTVFDEGDDIRAVVVASVVDAPFDEELSFRLIDVSAKTGLNVPPIPFSFTEAGRMEEFTILPNNVISGSDDTVSGSRELRLKLADSLPLGYGIHPFRPHLDLTLADKDTAILKVKALSLLPSLIPGGLVATFAGVEVDFMGKLEAPNGGILVGVGDRLTFTHKFKDSTPALTLTFTDTNGDGFLKGDELEAQATPSWRAGVGTFTTDFALRGDLPGKLTGAQFLAPWQESVFVKASTTPGGISGGGVPIPTR